MTENKRYFSIEYDEHYYIFDSQKISREKVSEKEYNFKVCGDALMVDDIVNLLNENDWLKKSIKRQQLSNEECSKYIEEVVKENEQLKEENKRFTRSNNYGR